MTRIQEIPFKALGQNRIVAWTVALMCYLVIMSLGISTYLNDAIGRFQSSLEQAVTVEITSHHQGFDALEVKKKKHKRQEKLFLILKSYSKVGRIETLNTSLLESFVMPWEKSKRDPLFERPLLVDVYPKRGKILNADDLNTYISRSLHGVKVYSLYPWKKDLITVAWTILIAALTLATFISLVSISMIVFTTYTGLCLHQRTVDILRLIGATNHFIAKRFHAYATSLAIKGSLWGAALALGTFLILMGSSLFKNHEMILITLVATPCFLTLLTYIGARGSFSFMLSNSAEAR